MKNRPLQAANQNFNNSDNSAIILLKPAPKKHRARCYMLRTGLNGFTENEILYNCRLSSGRNYASELEHHCDICLERLEDRNPDGIGTHCHYRFVHRDDVQRVISLINSERLSRITQCEIDDILSLYPDDKQAA